jgi:D-lyxose ketol-isomerase
MKRSEINQIMRRAEAFIRERGFYLPPFAYWTPEDWKKKGSEVSEIVHNRLGWDITDNGWGDFEHHGLFLFTIRNGSPEGAINKTGKQYAEKLLISEEGQITPMHFHSNKMEDIINRGGGTLVIEIYNADAADELANTPVQVSLDGVQYDNLPAGTILRLEAGESITLPPRMYHSFWSENGRTLIGEVSLVNDDYHDNHFLKQVGRFPVIEEDEPPVHLLMTDYDTYYRGESGLQGK